MDPVLERAKTLAAQTQQAILPVTGRIAYAVSHGQSYASHGYAVRTQCIARALNDHGLEILCMVRPGRPWDLGEAKVSLAPETTVNGVRYIHSRWLGAEPANELDRLERAAQQYEEWFRIYRPSAVLAASNWIVGLPAWVAATRLGLPFHYEVRGFWELSRQAREPSYENHPKYREEVVRDSFVACQATSVFTLNQPMKGELTKRGVNPSNIQIVPNGVTQASELKPADGQLRQRLGIAPDEKVIGYVGSFSPYEGLDQLLEACTELVQNGEKLKLLLVGDSQPLIESLAAHIADSGLKETPPWLIQVGRVPHEHVADYYALLDAVVIPRKPLGVCQLVPPMKAAEALAYGKRLVVSDVAPLAEYVDKYDGVVSFEAGSATSLATALQRSLKLPVPKPSAELLFSAHTEPMVRALRGEVADSVASASQQLEQLDVSQVDYATASQWFYRKGKLTDTLRALESLQARSVKFDKPKRDFQTFVAGMARLKGGWPLPPRQPNAGLMSRRQHVLYCLHQSMPHATNGYSTRSHGIAVGLEQAGFKVRATTRPGFPWDAGTKGLKRGYHESEVDGITYAACAGWNLNKTPLDYYLAEAADHYLREAQTSGAEVIAAASNYITALPALMAARRLGLPFVYEVRGLWEVTQASTQPEWAGSERYQLMRELEQQAALEADLVITLTEELADELASWGVPRERIEVVPNAVNAERFQPMAADAAIAKELKLKPGVPVIGYAGSAVAYEGLELLMEAMATLKKNGQAFTFVLVGDGKVIDTVKAKAKELGIEKECRFTGRVPFEEVPRYLSCMDILPIPRLSSAVTEMVSALKPLEAMAMGKALVLSDVSPHTTMAGPNGERARLFTKDSAQALSEALQALIDSPEERARLGQAARAWIEQERTWNHVTRRYADALQHVRRSRAAEVAKVALASGKDKSNAKRLEQITLGLIADQFTTDTLASAVKVVPLSPENWREELAQQPIDAMFVESAWKGNDWQWHKKVGYYSDEEFAPLSELLAHCREQGIPSLFWNKEDPVHFDRFRKAAALCDHVFTTDSRRIIPYLATPGALSQTASSGPFYASPKIHNLLPSTREWQATAAYGGTYYGKRYPERTEYMDKIMSAAAPLGLTIYDRQHDDPESPYKYPGPLGGYVAGSLSYEEMIQAYKAHPVQINVNSVLDSPTMFSRRVVETAACGSPLISGPAMGMNRYMEGAGHIVRTESEAAQALENLLYHPAYRWRVALKGARAIMRAHTTQHRLVQMLRTAGVVMLAPEPPAITLLTEELSKAAAERLLAQTLRPQRILANQWQADSKAKLEAAGIACDSPQAQSAEAGSLWLLADPRALADLEPEDLEDLAWPTVYAPQARIGFNRSPELAEGEWPGVALDNHPIDAGLQLLRPTTGMPASDLTGWAAQQPALALRKPPRVHEQAPNVAPKKTVVIAGHDLKFIKPFYPYFTQAGIRLLLDFWTGHNQHNEIASKRLVRQADTVFCEWTLGNAIWYGKHKREGQKLVGRLHLQEIDHALFPKIPFEAFDTVMFVGPHILRQGVAKNPVLKKNGVVVYNGVDVEGLQSVPRKPTNGKVLGFVGIVPQRKRFDLALDILRELRKEDDGYLLRVKGKRPEEYPWMANRPEEMAWYETQYRRLEEDPLLKGAVIFDPHGNDMPEWYAGIDFALSTSDFESFHFTIADGAASGCTPIILPWEGADEIYPKEWVYRDAKAAAGGIKAGPGDQASLKGFAKEKFSIISISYEMVDFLN
ncbi:glycosyltransferase [Marinobacter bryozoorum]|uniref:glycosyltransferase n=1 Tax=Marinobacter bryozoorum TaxID=256324 RepID=UPI0020067C46|nr:glycosyltransferase [Marinobacter bryozoorum]MCK7544314.1 glycosyltransferase [Marinobacter bryozoorum]